MISDNNKIMLKLLNLLKPYKKTIVFIFTCLIVSTLINLVIPILSKEIMDKGFIDRDYYYLVQMVAITFLLHVISGFLRLIKESKRIKVETSMRADLFKQAYDHLMKLKQFYFYNKNSEEIFNNINLDITTITTIAKEEAFFVLTQIFNIIGGLIGLFLIDYRLACVVLLFIPIKYYVIKFFAYKRKMVMGDYLKAHEKHAHFFGDSIWGVKEIKLFGILGYKKKQLDDIEVNLTKNIKKVEMLTHWNINMDYFLLQLLTLVLYLGGGILVIRNSLTIGGIFAFITYSTYVTDPISAILNISYYMSGIFPSAKRHFDFLELPEEAQYSVCPVKNGCLEFEDVYFYYDSGKPVLKHIGFKIQQQSKAAIVGSNGAGKTTIIELILRFIDPIHGRILLDNTDISLLPLDNYRALISVVSQHIYLFNDTIKNNICLYKNVSDNILHEILDICGLQEFVSEVSLEYVVGTGGSMLSGGQKQKIALARALVSHNPIVIFDEATSNTDVFSEKQIDELLVTYLKEQTVILVTHRLSVLKDVDVIIVLKDGEVNGIGDYKYLQDNNNYFYSMISL